MDGDDVGGWTGRTGSQRATLWRRGEPLVLHDAHIGWVNAMAGDEQVSVVWDRMRARAALWRGTPSSFVDLTPKAFEVAHATSCDAGLQAGFVRAKDESPSGATGALNRATVWSGDASGFVDLHDVVLAPFNVSEAMAIRVRDGEVMVAGTVEEVTDPDGRAAYVQQRGAVWRFRIRGG